MKQDQGKHAATPGPWGHIETLSRAKYIKTGTPTLEAIECRRALSERDRLKALNAELVTALEKIDTLAEEAIRKEQDTPGLTLRAIVDIAYEARE